jgi:hypothetical protein
MSITIYYQKEVHNIDLQSKLWLPVFDMGSLELFEDFLGLKSHVFEDFRP